MTILSKQYPMDLGTGTIEQVNQSAAKIDNEFTAIYGHLNNIRVRYRGATAPSNPESGQQWEDTVNAVVKKWNGSAWEEETASSTNLTNRNTVLQGQVSSAGALELILGSTSALTADLVSSTVATIIAIPAGHDDVMGNSDYIVSFSATQTDFWTSLPANNTSYLFVDYASGTVTGTYSVIAPVYQSYAPAHSAGLNWYDTNKEQWYLSDGSNWVAKYRCYVGYVVTDGTKVTATTIEPYNRIRANIIGTASLNVPLSYLDTDTTLAANSDKKIPSQKAVKARFDALTTSLPARQTVLKASVDTSGYANFITVGTGLAVNIAATAVPIEIAASYGTTDRKGTISADTTISSLTANATNYLFADIASDGTVTLGKTTLAPVYQAGGTRSIANGQCTFNIQEMSMTVGNGSVASQINRVFLGVAVCGASSVTSVINYALMGRFYSQEISIPATKQVPQITSHNIGVVPAYAKFYLVAQAAVSGYSAGDVFDTFMVLADGGNENSFGGVWTMNNFNFFLPWSGIEFMTRTTGGGNYSTIVAGNTNFKYKFIAMRGW